MTASRACPCGCGGLTLLEYEQAELEFCKRCRGAWLSFGNLTHIVHRRERRWPGDKIQAVLKKLDAYNAPPMGEDRELTCPDCAINLDEVNYQGTSNIVVNPCPELHGIWLDAGELVSIQIYMEHWNDYAKAHAEEIGETLGKISTAYKEKLAAKFVEQGPSSSKAANQLVFEALELLDEWRSSK